MLERYADHRSSYFRLWPAALALMIFVLTPLIAGVALATPPDIFIAYPPENHRVAFDHVLFEGSVPAGATLSVNGRALNVGPDGLFIEWLALKPGLNVLQLQSSLGAERSQREFRIMSQPPQTLPVTPTTIVENSVKPDADLKLYDLGGSLESRTITVAFEGSPGGTASFKIGGRGPFAMLETKAENFPGSTNITGGRYEGSLVLSLADHFEDAPISVVLSGVDGQTATATAKSKLTTGATGQLRVGIVTDEAVGLGVNASTTAARNGPARSHILQLKPGMKFPIVGEEANTYRVAIAPGQNVNILKNQLRLLPPGAPLPRTYFRRIETRRVANGTQVRFSLPDRVPFSVEQVAASNDQSLDVRLYGTESDVDYMVSAFPDELVRDIRWSQEQDGVFRARIDLHISQQWGYHAFYEGNTLVVQIKNPPRIDRARPLQGRRILIDPGHGGDELGAPGGLRVPEKDLVLLIALRLAEKLRSRGANVTLSREKDVKVPLYDRPILAEKIGAEVLLSVHANALPDGVDPATQRGAGVYYYHPQARALADALLGSLVRHMPDVGNDGIHYQNLALTRPTSQLSILIETAFMTDKGNLRLLMSPAGRERFAESIARGLEEFYRTQTVQR
jgi:N-acetylmuramoyl-L-alanine amidase